MKIIVEKIKKTMMKKFNGRGYKKMNNSNGYALS